MNGYVPDAVAAIIAAILREHPASAPEMQAQFAVAALVCEGWTVVAPEAITAALRAA